VCPICHKNGTVVGRYFQLPSIALAWQGAKELAQMDETFQAKNLSSKRIRRFVKAMASPTVREYLKLWPVWYRHFEYLVEHPEMLP
jgi:hypothetical protein